VKRRQLLFAVSVRCEEKPILRQLPFYAMHTWMKLRQVEGTIMGKTMLERDTVASFRAGCQHKFRSFDCLTNKGGEVRNNHKS